MADEEVSADKDFDAAFGEAVAEAEKGVQAGVKEEPVKEEPVKDAPEKDEPVKEALAKEEPVKDAPAKDEPVKDAVPAPAAAPAAVVAAPAPAPAAAPAKVEPEETPEQKKQREEFEAMLKPYEFSADEKAALEKFKEDFPNEYVSVEARMKQAERRTNQQVYQAVQHVLQQVYGDFAPMAKNQAEQAEERHFAALKVAHPDADALVEKIPAWIKTQPAYLQPTMQAVYDGGSTKDVIELLATFKAASGGTAPVAVAPVRKGAVPADAGDLAPVSEKRSAPVPKGEPDMNNFDAAFDEAARAK